MARRFRLTEPIPYVGVETGMLGGKVRVAEWEEGQEPMLQVEKRGRFITNMGFANFVTAAVDSDDPRIKGSCMVILEESDPGMFDRGVPTRKLVHQLSSTRDPDLQPAASPPAASSAATRSRTASSSPTISHSEMIEAVFRRTRVTVGLMTSAKLLSAVEPVIRYQRRRFRGGEGAPGTPRYELGLAAERRRRCTGWWTSGPPAKPAPRSALPPRGCSTELDPLEKQKDRDSRRAEASTGAQQLQALAKSAQAALECWTCAKPPVIATASVPSLKADTLVQFVMLDSLANVLCPACKLWNTGHGANMMREAVSLMGGYGVTEDCPGFLGQKWMDAQLEATYEGPEAVQRRQLSVTMTNESVPGAVPAVDYRDARSRQRPSRHRRLHPGHRHAALALDPQPPANATDADGAKLYQARARA